MEKIWGHCKYYYKSLGGISFCLSDKALRYLDFLFFYIKEVN